MADGQDRGWGSAKKCVEGDMTESGLEKSRVKNAGLPAARVSHCIFNEKQRGYTCVPDAANVEKGALPCSLTYELENRGG